MTFFSDPNQVLGKKAEPVGKITHMPSGTKTGDHTPGRLCLATIVLTFTKQSQFERC